MKLFFTHVRAMTNSRYILTGAWYTSPQNGRIVMRIMQVTLVIFFFGLAGITCPLAIAAPDELPWAHRAEPPQDYRNGDASNATPLLDVRDADLRQVLMDLAQRGHINLMISPKVSGRLSCRVTDMDTLELIQFIARANGLTYEDHGRIKLILAEEAQPTRVSFEIISLQNARAADVSQMIESLKLDKHTRVTHDVQGNRLIVIHDE
ncbi:MAG: hypothetical protein HQM09_06520 [Candidatus Riflebacteria bacterium]|nr:hypothetical protein [Candidatus Riflebacteria bacterium]